MDPTPPITGDRLRPSNERMGAVRGRLAKGTLSPLITLFGRVFSCVFLWQLAGDLGPYGSGY